MKHFKDKVAIFEFMATVADFTFVVPGLSHKLNEIENGRAVALQG